MVEKITEEFIEGLQKTGLTDDEALVYLTLIRHGKKGTYVKNLDNHLLLNRTTIYSILNRLVEKECIKISEKSTAPKKAKIFVATSPAVHIDKVLREKKNEINELEKIRVDLVDKLERLYLKSMEYSIDNIDDFVKPYFKFLMENGWKVIEQKIEKSKFNYIFEVYDCTLIPPNSKYIKDCGFLVFKFDYVVEKDQNILNFVIDLLKRIGKEQILNKDIGVKNVKISDSEIKFYNKKYTSFKIEFLWPKVKEYQEFTKSVVLPIKEKIFYLWAETYEVVKEMVDVIFNVESISNKDL